MVRNQQPSECQSLEMHLLRSLGQNSTHWVCSVCLALGILWLLFGLSTCQEQSGDS